MDDQTTESTTTDTDNQHPVSALDLLLITRAYNRKEISFEAWLKQTKEWAEQVIKQYGEGA
jgi:hypothetical protein